MPRALRLSEPRALKVCVGAWRDDGGQRRSTKAHKNPRKLCMGRFDFPRTPPSHFWQARGRRLPGSRAGGQGRASLGGKIDCDDGCRGHGVDRAAIARTSGRAICAIGQQWRRMWTAFAYWARSGPQASEVLAGCTAFAWAKAWPTPGGRAGFSFLTAGIGKQKMLFAFHDFPGRWSAPFNLPFFQEFAHVYSSL